jgi:CheY-like chemotaxis protein
MNVAVAPDKTKPLNILLVEDDDGDAMAVERAFRKARVANPIMRAVDGVEALEILRGVDGRQKPSAPYVLLVDINMPRKNGIQLVQELRADAQLHNTIVFILTTSKRDEDVLAAYALNVAGYIVKEKAGREFLNLASLIDCYWRIVEIP